MLKKRLLSFFMACCMTLTFLPPPAASAYYDNAPTDAESVSDVTDDATTTDADDVADDAPTDDDDVTDDTTLMDDVSVVLDDTLTDADDVTDVTDSATPTDADDVTDVADDAPMDDDTLTDADDVTDVTDSATPTDADDVTDVADDAPMDDTLTDADDVTDVTDSATPTDADDVTDVADDAPTDDDTLSDVADAATLTHDDAMPTDDDVTVVLDDTLSDVANDATPTDAADVTDVSGDEASTDAESVTDVADDATPTDDDDVTVVLDDTLTDIADDETPTDAKSVTDVANETPTDDEETVYQITVPVSFEEPDDGEDMATLLGEIEEEPVELPTELPGYMPEARLFADSAVKTYYYFRGLTSITLSDIPLDYEGTTKLGNGLLQIVDSNGKILLSVSKSYYDSSHRYYYSYDSKYDSELKKTVYYNHRVTAYFYLPDTALMTVGNKYKLQLVIGEEIYFCNAEIVPVDGYYLSSASLESMYTDETTFSATLGLYGFRTEDDISKLKLELLDGDGENANVVATSTGNYYVSNASYYPSKAANGASISLLMELKLKDGAELKSQRYYLRVSSVGKPLYTNLTMPYSSASNRSAPNLSITEAQLTKPDPAEVRVKLGVISQSYLDDGYDVLLVAANTDYYYSSDMDSILKSASTYASVRFKKNELPADKTVTLSLHNSQRNSDSAYTMGSIYVNAFFVKTDEEGKTSGTRHTYINVRNPYSTSSDNTGSYSFYPEYVSTSTTSIPFSIRAQSWNSVYHTYEDNVAELRKGEDEIIAACSDIKISYAESRSYATLTGEFKVSALEKGTYNVYYNGAKIDTLNVIDNLRFSNLTTAYYGSRYESNKYVYSFWTQFGEFYEKFRINGGTGSGALVFRKDDADALFSGTIQGAKTNTDEWVYEYAFTAAQLKTLTVGESYDLIFRDANGQEVSIFSSYSYNTETVWPEKISDVCYIYQGDSSTYGATTYQYRTLAGDDVVYARLYPDKFRNASLATLQDTLKKITFTMDAQTITVKEVGKPFFDGNSNYLYVSLKLSAPLTTLAYSYTDTSYSYHPYTVHYGPKPDGEEEEYTTSFYVWNSQVSYLSTSRGLLNVFQAEYFPVDKTYTGKLYQGAKCLTPKAFPMTLSGAYGTSQVLSYEQSVLDALKLPEGNYTLVVFMDGEIIESLSLEIHYDEIVPSITLYGHHSYTDGVKAEDKATWEGEYYTDYYYYSSYDSRRYIVIADQTGKYRLHAYNYGDYRYFRFADSLTALASAEFQRVGTGYFEGVLSDKTTRGWRTIYAEFSKKGVSGDSSNYTASNTIYVASNGDFGLTVPDEVGGLHENNKSYTITAALDTPNGIVWIGFHDQNGKVAYDYTTSSSFRDGKYYYSYSFTPSSSSYNYGFTDSNYTGGDNSHTFRYIDTQSIEIFATDNDNVSRDGVRYRGNIVSETVKRDLMFGSVDTIVLRSSGGNLNTRTHTISGYAVANDEITVTEGETSVATAKANEYGYFTVEVKDIADGAHTYSVTGKNTKNGATTSVSVDATPPVINAFTYAFLQDGQNMVLRWYCDDEDVSGFTLYKNDETFRSIGGAERRLNIVSEPNNTFSITATDKYGNVSERVERVFTDNEAPVAAVSPEKIQVGANIEVVFDGGTSSDDFGIASYSWNFGDGSSPALTRKASHTFKKLGEYTVTLTVTDYTGKTATATSAVTVVDAGTPTNFTTLDTTTQKIVSGVTLTVTDPQGQIARYTTGSNGKTTLYLPNGLYSVTAVASGYQVRSFSFEITDKRHDFTLYMNTEDVLKVETKVTEMTKDEIVAAGIDTSAPENQHVYNCVATFEFGKLEYIANDTGIIKSEPLKAGNITAYAVEKDIFLIVYSQVNWLKEMFRVQLLVTNTSDYEVVEDCEAKLTVPDGLSLAKMTEEVGAQSADVKLGMVEMGGKKVNDWYLAGDKEGTYTLEGTVTGIRVGGGIKEDISVKFKTSEPIQVQAGKAMKLDITAERYAIFGQPYNVKYTLENVSGKELYDVSLNVLGGKFIEAYSVSELTYEKELGPDLSGKLTDGFSLYAETLKPEGDEARISGFFTVKFGEGLDIANADGMKYVLKDMFVTTGAGSTTEIPTELHITDNKAFLLAFDGNGSTGSMPSVITAKSADADGTEVTMPSSALTPPTGKVSAGWEWNGKTYQAGEKVKIANDSIKDGVATLKAVWEDAIYTASYKANGGSGSMDAVQVKGVEKLKLPDNGFTPPAFKKFRAWQIGETEYAPGTEVALSADADVTALWDDITYTVTYAPGEGAGEMEAATATAGVAFKLPDNAFTASDASLYKFKAWKIGETEYAPGAEYTFTADTTVTAVWENITYAVTYEANGGTGEMAAATATAGKPFKLPDSAFTPPEFKKFKAWKIGDTEYSPGAEYTFTADATVTAVWEVITYAVTYDANGGTGTMDGATATAGVAFKLPKSGFTAPQYQKFKAWKIGDTEYSPGAEYTFTADATVTAVWEVITYAVTYDANGGTGTMDGATATAGQPFKLPENAFAAPEFKRFKAWRIGADELAPGAEYTFSANATVKAIWENITYTVTYEANGGTGEMAPGIATAGKAFKLPKSGFTAPEYQKLKAWRIDGKEYEPGAEYTFTADATVTAVWEVITYAVTYDANGGTGTMEAATATAGVAFKLPDNAFAAPEFKKFKAWRIGADELAPGAEYTFSANATVKAIWENITYTVTYEANGGTGEMAPGTATAGKAFKLPKSGFTAPEYQKLKAWRIDGKEYEPGAEYTFTADATVTAVWEVITYAVTYDANGGMGTMDGATATAGVAFKLPDNAFAAPEFKKFKAWQISGKECAPGEEHTFTANTTVKAVWENITYTVTYEANGGTGEMAPGTATAGKAFKLPKSGFTAPEFKKLKAWRIGGEEYEPGGEYTFTADATVTAVWEFITYAVTYEANGGTGEMTAATATAGKPFRLPNNNFDAPEFKKFKAWQIGGKEYAPGAEYTFTANATVKAVWDDIIYTVTYDGNGGTRLMDAASAKAGQPFALPSNGFSAPKFQKFKAWEIDGKEYAPGTEYTFSADTVVKALWEDIPYTVSYDANGGTGEMTAATATASKPFILPECRFTAPSLKQFKAWEINGREYAPGAEYTFTANATVKAVWKDRVFVVTYDANGGKGSIDAVSVKAGQTFTLPNNAFTPPKFQRFAAWEINGSKYAPGAEAELFDDVTVKAVWTDITYIVSYHANGGLGSMDAVTVTAGKPFKLPDNGFDSPASREFKAWEIDGEDGKEYAPGAEYTFTADTVVKALWGDITYAVNFDANGGAGTMKAQRATSNQPFRLPGNGFTAPNYHKFKAWEIDGREYGPGGAYTFSADTTVKAIWQKAASPDATFTVTFDTDGGSYVNPQTVRMNGFAAQPAQNPEKENFQFSAWTLNGQTYNFDTPVTSDICLTAQWATRQYTIRFLNDDGTELSAEAYDYGTAAENIKAPVATKAPVGNKTFTFNAWLPEIADVTGSAMYIATYTETVIDPNQTQTVTFAFDNGDPAVTETVQRGETVEKPRNTPLKDGFRFVQWTLDGKAYDFSSPVTEDITLTAQWQAAQTFRVTFESNGGSAVESQSVPSGDAATKPKNPAKEGYAFIAWYRDANLTQLYNFAEPVESNLTLYAQWAEPKQGCYVATAVYGSYDCPEVWTLRRFRDNVLAKTWYGRLFIRLYYAVSPTAVRLFGDCAWFTDFFRGQLDKLVSNLQSDGFESAPYQDLDW